MISISRGEFLKGLLSASALGLSGCLSFSYEDERLQYNAEFLRSGIIGPLKRIDIWNSKPGTLEETFRRLISAAYLAYDFGPLIEAECVIAYGTGEDHAPESSIVNLTYADVAITWYDGNECPSQEKEHSGCRIIGNEGDLFIPDENEKAPHYDEELSRRISEGVQLAILAQKNPGRVIKVITSESAKNCERQWD